MKLVLCHTKLRCRNNKLANLKPWRHFRYGSCFTQIFSYVGHSCNETSTLQFRPTFVQLGQVFVQFRPIEGMKF